MDAERSEKRAYDPDALPIIAAWPFMLSGTVPGDGMPPAAAPLFMLFDDGRDSEKKFE